ncbi:MAG: protein LphB [Acidobacteriaceae bacterium]
MASVTRQYDRDIFVAPVTGKSFNTADFVALAALALVTTLYLVTHITWNGLPMEDALMLLRYSRHVAEGFGIRWNVGEAPVEGATDFLYMVLVGVVSRVGHVGVIFAGRILLMCSHLVAVLVLFTGARRLFSWPLWASLALSIYFAFDIARAYITTGFSAPFYSLVALVAWYLTLRAILRGPTPLQGSSIGVALALLYLIRPEGIFMAFFILVAMLYALGRPALRAVFPAMVVLLAIGVPYFFWRWHYFGYPFPNPLYLKGGGHLHFDSLRVSFTNTLVMLAPVVPLYLFELFSPRRKRALTALIPTTGFACIWILLSNENNHFMRFQYCGVPLALLGLPYATNALSERFRDFQLRPAFQVIAVLATAVFALQYWGPLSRIPAPDFGLYNIATEMNTLKDKGYTVATTEAGIIPFFSDWPSVDLYGLNDPEIVHNPHGLTQEYLARRNPAVILNHVLPREDLKGPLKQAVESTNQYALAHNYELAAVWGYNLCDRHLWYIRRDLPEAEFLIASVRRSPYLITGTTMLDLRDVPVPESCSEVVHLGRSQ